MTNAVRSSVTITISIGEETEKNLLPLRRELSNMIEPLPLVGLVEWTYLIARRNESLATRLRAEVPTIDLPPFRSLRTSSVRMDEEALEWLQECIPVTSARALLSMMFVWISENGLDIKAAIKRDA